MDFNNDIWRKLRMLDIPILKVPLPFNTEQIIESHCPAGFTNSITGLVRKVSFPPCFDTDIADSLEEDVGLYWEDWCTTACSNSLSQIFLTLVGFRGRLSLIIMCTWISVEKMPQRSWIKKDSLGEDIVLLKYFLITYASQAVWCLLICLIIRK